MSAPVSRFRVVIVVGCGQVVLDRLRLTLPVLRSMGVQRFVYLDVHAHASFPLAPDESYLQVLPGSLLPLDTLTAFGLLGRRTAAVVCTPSAFHLHYAEQLQPHVGLVACEKPLTLDYRAAQLLLATHPNLHPISHFLFKTAMTDWLARCRTDRMPWRRECVGIRVYLHESKGIGTRQIDPALFDLGWHAWELLLAPFRAAGYACEVELRSARTATYDPPPGEPRPSGATAARLVGKIRVGGCRIPFDASFGKGLGEDAKALVYELNDGTSIRVALGEGGAAAHQRLLQELLGPGEPALGLDLADAVELVRLCAVSQAEADDEGIYPFGRLPEFFADDSLQGLYF